MTHAKTQKHTKKTHKKYNKKTAKKGKKMVRKMHKKHNTISNFPLPEKYHFPFIWEAALITTSGTPSGTNGDTTFFHVDFPIDYAGNTYAIPGQSGIDGSNITGAGGVVTADCHTIQSQLIGGSGDQVIKSYSVTNSYSAGNSVPYGLNTFFNHNVYNHYEVKGVSYKIWAQCQGSNDNLNIYVFPVNNNGNFNPYSSIQNMLNYAVTNKYGKQAQVNILGNGNPKRPILQGYIDIRKLYGITKTQSEILQICAPTVELSTGLKPALGYPLGPVSCVDTTVLTNVQAPNTWLSIFCSTNDGGTLSNPVSIKIQMKYYIEMTGLATGQFNS